MYRAGLNSPALAAAPAAAPATSAKPQATPFVQTGTAHLLLGFECATILLSHLRASVPWEKTLVRSLPMKTTTGENRDSAACTLCMIVTASNGSAGMGHTGRQLAESTRGSYSLWAAGSGTQ